MIQRAAFAFSTKSFYMRKLPDQFIRLASEQGKTIFRQALEEGNMECYFPLAQQFVTQLEPSTCGPTSLVMVLNSLGVDPMKRWKGGWRWYTEENLNMMTKQILAKGLHLESWTHIARHNHLDVTTFYYPDQKVVQKRLGEMRKPDCDCDNPLLLKTASFETFKDCVLSSARREGFILTLNHSRRQMQQTGSGHYSPIGGYNRKRGLTLMLDVARFKYPSYWCDTRRLYESLSEIDPESELPRGYVLVSRQMSSRSEICNVGLDYPTARHFHRLLHKLSKESTGKYLIDSKFVASVLNVFDQLIRSTWVYFLFELDSHGHAEKTQLYHDIKKEATYPQFQQALKQAESSNMLNSNAKELKRLIEQFELGRFQELAFILLHSLPAQLVELPVPASQLIRSRTKSLRRSFGLFRQQNREGEYF